MPSEIIRSCSHRRRLLYREEGAEAGIAYLLRATFTAGDQGFADGQALDTEAEGVEDGSLTVVETAGTVELTGNKLKITGSGSWHQAGVYDPVGCTRSLGLAAIVLNWSCNIAHPWPFGFHSAPALATPLPGGLGITASEIYARAPVAVVVGAVVVDTDYDFAFVLGGYDSSGNPWYSGAGGGPYTYGMSLYVRGGAYTAWTLLWRDSSVNDSPVYFTATSRYAGRISYHDSIQIPDADLSAVLQPTCLSTFDAANGTSLDAITPEVGGTWTEQSGDWDIQSNRANAPSQSGAFEYATVDSGESDVMLDAITATGQAATDERTGLVLRWSDSSNFWFTQARRVGNNFRLYEVNGGVTTQRASAAVTINSNTDYDQRVIAYGQTIDAFLDGGNKISYGSSVLNETETEHGLRSKVDGALTNNNRFENFAVYARTSAAVYDATFDAY